MRGTKTVNEISKKVKEVN